eukprot:TRINITY_DN9229_c0_g1_i1.p1 TRINITY_DN9229_c0_g1~~TRINITY_DN9229_c0_g1_i1.p1  ORF type:complete len:413 (+),score=77.90 TRINITY_DN9229_c0_g1_i1:115-1239(+)
MKDSEIKEIITGYEHVLIHKINGEIIGMGSNNTGQLDINPTKSLDAKKVKQPKVLIKDKQIKRVYAGYAHTLIEKYNGELTFIGRYLGDSDDDVRNDTLSFVDTQINSIVTGEHTLILRNNGDLLGFGRNDYGDLGLNTTEHINDMTLITNDPTIVSIHITYSASFLLKVNGEVYSSGCNLFGVLGNGEEDHSKNFELAFVEKDIQSFFTGGRHSMYRKKNGDIYGFGSNKFGQLGLDKSVIEIRKPTFIVNDSTIKSIFFGAYFTVFHKTNGDIISFGENSAGQLGDGTFKENCDRYCIMKEVTNVKAVLTGGSETVLWKPENHLYFSKLFVVCVFRFVLSLKLFLKRKGIQKMPKYLLFHILNYYINVFYEK